MCVFLRGRIPAEHSGASEMQRGRAVDWTVSYLWMWVKAAVAQEMEMCDCYECRPKPHFVLWSTVVRCKKLVSPSSGSLKCSDPLGPSSYQSTCTFTCDDGYELDEPSSDVLLCESSGNWNTSQPSCVGAYTPARTYFRIRQCRFSSF